MRQGILYFCAAMLLVATGPAEGQRAPPDQAAAAPRDTCVLELQLPEEATVQVDRRDYGAEQGERLQSFWGEGPAAFSPDGSLAATTGNGSVCIWDPFTGLSRGRIFCWSNPQDIR